MASSSGSSTFQWPDNVIVIDADHPGNAQDIINKIYSVNGGTNPECNGQFSDKRFALLFKPGKHKLDVNVGYYTSVMGLGVSPGDTQLQSLKSGNGSTNFTIGALNNFWRSAENVLVDADVTWAVSQAAPMRRCVVGKKLWLFESNGGPGGYASGGFMADSVVGGDLITGSQQQWLTRNTKIGKCGDALWNMVHVGNTGDVPATHTGEVSRDVSNPKQTTTIPSTPVIAEKPYIAYVKNEYVLCVPPVEFNKTGPTADYTKCQQIPFTDHVYVASCKDSASLINAQLDAGKHVILTPGLYYLNAPLVIKHPDTVVLGIGFPSLISTGGQACVQVASVPGVRIAGILLEAGEYKQPYSLAPVLLQWGSPRASNGSSSSNPGVMSDVFARVGHFYDNASKQANVGVETMVQIWASNVIIDNTWLWRADHDVNGLVKNGDNPCYHALLVLGDAITAYGLAVEHTLQDACVWNGNDGQTYFFQCELPYDVSCPPGNAPWPYVGYHVTDKVTSHLAYGVGVYSFFRDYNVFAENGIFAPSTAGVQFVNSFTRFLDGQGGINHVINGLGTQVHGPADPSTPEYIKLAYVAYLQTGYLSQFMSFWKAPFQQPKFANNKHDAPTLNATPQANTP